MQFFPAGDTCQHAAGPAEGYADNAGYADGTCEGYADNAGYADGTCSRPPAAGPAGGVLGRGEAPPLRGTSSSLRAPIWGEQGIGMTGRPEVGQKRVGQWPGWLRLEAGLSLFGI